MSEDDDYDPAAITPRNSRCKTCEGKGYVFVETWSQPCAACQKWQDTGKPKISPQEMEALADVALEVQNDKNNLVRENQALHNRITLLRAGLKEMTLNSPTRATPHRPKCKCAWCLRRGRAKTILRADDEIARGKRDRSWD